MSCYRKAIKLDDIRKKFTGKGYVSLSFGKDSTAMVLKMCELNQKAIEKGVEEPYPFEECCFADTGFEYPQLYDYIEKISRYIENKYNKKCVVLKPEKNLWESWFYGKWSKGKFKNTPRGFPMVVSPCYYSRESKVKQLEKYYKGKAGVIYIGIAHDEQKRLGNSPSIRYPLNEWQWSELDCSRYLKEKGFWNSLYNNYDRLGCYFCHKQSLWSWYVTWKYHNDLFQKSIFWDEESRRITIDNHGIRIDMTLKQLGEKFEKGYVPKRKKDFIGKIEDPSTIQEYGVSCDSVASAFEIYVEEQKNKFKEEQIKGLGKVESDFIKLPKIKSK